MCGRHIRSVRFALASRAHTPGFHIPCRLQLTVAGAGNHHHLHPHVCGGGCGDGYASGMNHVNDLSNFICLHLPTIPFYFASRFRGKGLVWLGNNSILTLNVVKLPEVN